MNEYFYKLPGVEISRNTINFLCNESNIKNLNITIDYTFDEKMFLCLQDVIENTKIEKVRQLAKKKMKENSASFRRYELPEKIKNQFYAILPKSFLKIEIPNVELQTTDRQLNKKGQGESLVIHTDTDRSAVVNFYLKTQNEKTTFYDVETPGCTMISKKYDMFMPRIFDNQWVKESCHFVSENFDSYLLNVKKPHSVQGVTKDSRICLSFSFQTKYEKLLNCI